MRGKPAPSSFRSTIQANPLRHYAYIASMGLVIMLGAACILSVAMNPAMPTLVRWLATAMGATLGLTGAISLAMELAALAYKASCAGSVPRALTSETPANDENPSQTDETLHPSFRLHGDGSSENPALAEIHP